MMLPARSKVLACRVFQPELSALGLGEDQVEYLDQGLHRYPNELRERLGQSLARLEEDPEVDRVILLYGFCGGGLENLTSCRLEMVLPLVHDCVPLLLGKDGGPPSGSGPAAFFLSQGWIDFGNTPYSEYFVTAEKFDEETALWTSREMLKGYDRVLLIRTLAGLEDRHRNYALDMARLFEMGYEEMEADSRGLQRLLAARPGGGVKIIPPGSPVKLAIYPGMAPLAAPGTDGGDHAR
jgi:hypothetical protein